MAISCRTLMLFLFPFFVLCGCATLHKQNMATQVDQDGKEVKIEKPHSWHETSNGLIISGEIDREKSSKYFGYIDFVFENKTQEWLVIKKVALNFGDKKINEKVKFVSGVPLEIYMEAVQEKLRIEAENKQTTAAVLAGVAAGLSHADKSRPSLASSALLGAAVSLNVENFNKNRDQIENSKIFPRDHLFSEEFIIPPGMFRKKWIVLNTRDHDEIGEIKHIQLTYWMTNGKDETVDLPLWNYSSWQSR